MTRPVGDSEFSWHSIGPRLEALHSRLRQSEDQIAGCSSREVVWRNSKVTLYRYLPLRAVKSARVRPILICYALVNRPEVLDLEPDRSLIQRLLAHGLEVYLIDWGRPDESDRKTDLAIYLNQYLHGAVRHLLKSRRIAALNLVGVCQGGTFSLCYCAQHPQHVANLVTMVTPVDFHTPTDLLSKWTRHLDVEALCGTGNLPGMVLTAVFLSLRPFRLMQQKYIDALAHLEDARAMDTFARMERWIFDSPDQAAAAVSEFVRWLYQENRLVQGTLSIGGRRVDLRRICQPVLNIYALEDHIVPPAGSTALRTHLGGQDYTELPIATGHIGMYVSSASQLKVASAIATWLRARR